MHDGGNLLVGTLVGRHIGADGYIDGHTMTVHVPITHTAESSSVDLEFGDVLSRCGDFPDDTTDLLSDVGMTLESRPPWASGHYTICLFGTDGLVVVRNMQVNRSLVASVSSLQNTLSMEFVLDDSSDLQFGDRNLPNSAEPRVYISSHRSNSQMTYFHKPGDTNHSITLIIPPKRLFEEFGLEPCKLGRNIQSILYLESNGTITLPLTAKLKSILNETIEMPFSGVLAEQYLKAKITELLCHTVQHLNAPDQLPNQINTLPTHKSNAINRTIQCLNEDLSNPPKMDELAKLVGMSRNTLSSTFKTCYGMGVSEYLLRKKMETALALLEEGKHSVLEVSQAVGYDTQSSFSRAYKRFFDRLPKEDKPNQ